MVDYYVGHIGYNVTVQSSPSPSARRARLSVVVLDVLVELHLRECSLLSQTTRLPDCPPQIINACTHLRAREHRREARRSDLVDLLHEHACACALRVRVVALCLSEDGLVREADAERVLYALVQKAEHLRVPRAHKTVLEIEQDENAPETALDSERRVARWGGTCWLFGMSR